MKRLLFIALICFPLIANAQTKIKETEVPKAVLITLAKTYDSYKVKTWYQAPGQYIADFIIDGQAGRGYFTASGEWQYSSFPVKPRECPSLMITYINENYPGYTIKEIAYEEEMSGDNYYRAIIAREAIDAAESEMVFDTRGKLMKTNAPDPEDVKRQYYTLNNPEYDNGRNREKYGQRPVAEVDEPEPEKRIEPTEPIADHFEKNHAKRVKDGPEWVGRERGAKIVAYYVNSQKVEIEVVYNMQTGKPEWVGKTLEPARYKKGVIKYLDEKFKGEKYKIAKMVVYTADSKYRDETGKKPKPYTYAVVSQKINGQVQYTRLEFDNKDVFTGLLSGPLDELDVQ